MHCNWTGTLNLQHGHWTGTLALDPGHGTGTISLVPIKGRNPVLATNWDIGSLGGSRAKTFTNNLFQIVNSKMVNATCDFCENSYRRNPNVGYFKVTEALKISLCLREGAGINTICGEHFAPNEISESGRLQKDAKPVFFHRKSTAAHDHNYFYGNLSEDEGEGKNSHFNICIRFV